jgi:hypothetical protein
MLEAEMENYWDSGLSPGEDLAATMHRSRQARRRESQLIDEAYRQWWLDEQGWLVDSATHDRRSQPSPIDGILVSIADALLVASGWLRSRSKSVAELPT